MNSGRDALGGRDAFGRRKLLQACGAAAIAGLAGCSGGSGDGSGPYDGWLDAANGFQSVRDRTGESEIRIGVGADGGLAFDPVAVRISPDTDVVWEWTGEGGAHNVHERDDAFRSELSHESGFTFRHSFDAVGVFPYVCDPHEQRGMKGVIEVVDQ